jgi:hypothetical protein
MFGTESLNIVCNVKRQAGNERCKGQQRVSQLAIFATACAEVFPEP